MSAFFPQTRSALARLRTACGDLYLEIRICRALSRWERALDRLADARRDEQAAEDAVDRLRAMREPQP